MICYRCGSELTKSDFCPECGEKVSLYKKIMSLSNVYYNDALEKANVRNLSGAVTSLQQSLKLNKNNIEARNLLGLIYYETGDTVAALSEWVISKNLETAENHADKYMNELRNNPTRLDMLNQNIKKYNLALKYSRDGSFDVAIIQLKKVLSSNPKFLAAHQLLGLLYLKAENYAKAEKELSKALSIDNGNTMTRRYLQEAQAMLTPDEDNDMPLTERKITGDVVEYKNGNETIIQPIHSLQPKGAVSLISIAIGIVLGALAAVFLILPGRISEVNQTANNRISAISEEADVKAADLMESESTIDDLNAQVKDLQSTLDSYSETDETVTAMNELMAAINVYITNRSDTASIAKHMDKVDMKAVGSSASEEFTTLYNTMIDIVGPTLSNYYYKSGYAAYDSQDYKTAITDLGKAYGYNKTNEAALYFEASAYYENGDSAKAKKIYDQVIDEFPDTKYATNAETRIAEINNEEG